MDVTSVMGGSGGTENCRCGERFRPVLLEKGAVAASAQRGKQNGKKNDRTGGEAGRPTWQ